MPGGSKIAVTDENKHEYVRLISRHRMTTGIKSQVRRKSNRQHPCLKFN